MKPLLEGANDPVPATVPSARPADFDDPRVIQALEEYQAALESGRRPSRAEFLARYADVASALGECLDGLDLVRSAASDLHPPPVPRAMPGRLGDFRLLRELGRGGMGVVYEAEQLSLGRRVALKVLPTAATLDDRQRRRFAVEAQAAGCLQHPHIVPVYTVGHEDGTSYYAMQLVEGPTLAAVIDHLARPSRAEARDARTRSAPASALPQAPTVREPATEPTSQTAPARLEPALSAAGLSTTGAPYSQAVARLVAQAADAVQHAHENGVLHRDIKPSNLLLDASGRLWVTDFGLARFVSDVRLTRTGDLVGTLRYVSPEQARNRPADHRADVYALGVTLYELLTLQPAFPGEDRHKLLLDIAGEEPTPPRRLNPQVPRDLETIVLKAMAKEPTERYATAQELADDLRRFLAGQPVLARRPSQLDATLKWARRHQAVVLTALAGLLLTTTALTVGLVRERRARADLENTARHLREMVSVWFRPSTEGLLERQALADPRQARAMRGSLEGYEQLLRVARDEPSLRFEAARAARRIGDLRRLLRDDGAEEAYAQADAWLAALDGPSAGWEVAWERAVLCNNRSHLAREAGRLDDAERGYREARRLFGAVAEANPQQPAPWQGLAGSTTNLALVLQQQDRLAEAETAFRDALVLRERLADAYPEETWYAHERAAAENNLANLLRTQNRFDEAEPLYRAALGHAASLLERDPTDPAHRQAVAAMHHGLGLLLRARNRLAPAEAELEEAARARARLVTEGPNAPDVRRDLASALHDLGVVRWQQGKAAPARAAWQEALKHRQFLAEAFPQEPAYAADAEATRRALKAVEAPW